MASLNVRGVADDVMAEFRVAAARAGKTLRDWVLDTLVAQCDRRPGRGEREPKANAKPAPKTETQPPARIETEPDRCPHRMSSICDDCRKLANATR
jgi:plasmid stability protein